MATLVSPAEGYRLWSQTYDKDPNPLLGVEFRGLSAKLGPLDGKVFLDVACGTGRWMAYAVSGGATVLGVDLNARMLSVARTKPSIEGRLVQAEGHRLPLADHSADIVMCSFSLGYFESPERSIQELRRVAKRGGRVFTSDMHPVACREGWRRTFRSGAGVFEIESHPYTAEQLMSWGRSAGLKVRETLDLYMAEPERLLMERAGKGNEFGRISDIPAVLIVEWENP